MLIRTQYWIFQREIVVKLRECGLPQKPSYANKSDCQSNKGPKMEFWVIQTFNSFSYAAIIFLLASGLSIIYGVMDIVNVAHASFYLLGGYVGLTAMKWTGNFYVAALAGVFCVILIAIVLERFFLRPLEGKLLSQVLITIGIALIFQDLCSFLA